MAPAPRWRPRWPPAAPEASGPIRGWALCWVRLGASAAESVRSRLWPAQAGPRVAWARGGRPGAARASGAWAASVAREQPALKEAAEQVPARLRVWVYRCFGSAAKREPRGGRGPSAAARCVRFARGPTGARGAAAGRADLRSWAPDYFRPAQYRAAIGHAGRLHVRRLHVIEAFSAMCVDRPATVCASSRLADRVLQRLTAGP